MSKAKNVHEITLKVEGNEWEQEIEKAFKKVSQKIKVDGFRPGKAPRAMVEKKYGKEALYMDAVDNIVQERYTKVILDSKLEPVVQPKVDIKSVSEKGVELVFTITTRPEVNIKKYKDLGIKKEEVKVTKKEAEEKVIELQKQYAEIVIKEGKVENGDTAVIDFEGFNDGVAFEGGKGANYPLEIGSHTFIPGFEEQLVGMNKDEEKDINVTFPKDYPSEELKGKEVVFKVKVREIKTKTLPELNEEFFLDLGMEDVKTKDELIEKMKEEIKAEKEYQAENKYVDALLDEIIKNTEVDLPEEFIENEVHRMLHQFEDNIKMQGLTLEQYCEFIKTDIRSIEEQMKPEAIKRVKSRLILEEIAGLEKIEITNEEAEHEAEHMATHYQMTKEELLKAFGGLEMIKYDLQMRKTLELIQGK
ncbi:MAG: trigger factor [Firmicutes bacterium]|nr:trigger factor [Bacillota bacterium]